MHVRFGALDVVVQVVPEHEELIEGFLPTGSRHHMLPLYRELEKVNVSTLCRTHKHSPRQLSRLLEKTVFF